MKNHLRNFLLSVGFLLLMNCTSQSANITNIKREWMLVEFQNFSKDVMIQNKAKLDLSKTTVTDKNFSAAMGCNNIFGQANFKSNGTVTFSKMGSTEMFCDGNMDLETEFGKILPTITAYKVEGHRLTLSNKNGALLKFVAADWD